MSDSGEDTSVDIDEEEQTDEERDTEAINMLRYDLSYKQQWNLR
jgi:hypothetical protein